MHVALEPWRGGHGLGEVPWGALEEVPWGALGEVPWGAPEGVPWGALEPWQGCRGDVGVDGPLVVEVVEEAPQVASAVGRIQQMHDPWRRSHELAGHYSKER